MVAVSSRTFKFEKQIGIDELYPKLKNSRKFEEKVDNPETGELETLLTTIDELKVDYERKAIRGVISNDRGVQLPPDRNGRIKFHVVPDKIPFAFLSGSLFFIPFVSSKLAEGIAYKIGRMVMKGVDDPILSCNITPAHLRRFLDRHPHQTTDESWAGLNLPNLARARLTGTNVGATADFDRYDGHGDPVTVRIRLLSNNWALLINSDAVVTFYNNQPQEAMEDFLRKEIFPICS